MNVERWIRLIGGTFVVLAILAGDYVAHAFDYFALFVGLNLAQSAFTGWCPMMTILRKAGVNG
jgi:hypothetical protein